MTDSTLNRFVASGTAAEMAAFTPDPPTPGSGPDAGYFFFQTDTGDAYSWDAGASDWVQIGGGVAYTDENARDAIGAALSAGQGMVVTVDDAGNAIGLALSNAAFRKTVQIQVTDPAGSAITTGDGKAYFRIPSTLNGLNLVEVAATVTTVSSSGLPTVQIANVTDSVDMLSTKVSIDASETDSATAATAAVIDTSHDDVATGDLLRVDVDVAGTGTKGLIVTLVFG